MKKEIKEKWVAALRSGEYKQGCFGLRSRKNEYCCLGVLADIYMNEKGFEWDHTSSGDYSADGSAGSMGPNVMNWAGLMGSEFGHVPDSLWRGEPATLSRLNDMGRTFIEIADIIETKL